MSAENAGRKKMTPMFEIIAAKHMLDLAGGFKHRNLFDKQTGFFERYSGKETANDGNGIHVHAEIARAEADQNRNVKNRSRDLTANDCRYSDSFGGTDHLFHRLYHRGVKCLVPIGDRLIVAIGREQILYEVVCAETQEIDV